MTTYNTNLPIVLKSSCTLVPSLALVSMNSALEFFANVSPVALNTYNGRD